MHLYRVVPVAELLLLLFGNYENLLIFLNLKQRVKHDLFFGFGDRGAAYSYRGTRPHTDPISKERS